MTEATPDYLSEMDCAAIGPAQYAVSWYRHDVPSNYVVDLHSGQVGPVAATREINDVEKQRVVHKAILCAPSGPNEYNTEMVYTSFPAVDETDGDMPDPDDLMSADTTMSESSEPDADAGEEYDPETDLDAVESLKAALESRGFDVEAIEKWDSGAVAFSLGYHDGPEWDEYVKNHDLVAYHGDAGRNFVENEDLLDYIRDVEADG